MCNKLDKNGLIPTKIKKNYYIVNNTTGEVIGIVKFHPKQRQSQYSINIFGIASPLRVNGFIYFNMNNIRVYIQELS